MVVGGTPIFHPFIDGSGFSINHPSLDWFSRENLHRKPWFLPLNMGVSGSNFPVKTYPIPSGKLT